MRKKEIKQAYLAKEADIVSTNECTGLMPALPDTDAEAETVKDIYNIP